MIGEKAKAEGEFGGEDESERELFGSMDWLNAVVGDVGSLGLSSPAAASTTTTESRLENNGGDSGGGSG